MNYGIRYHSDFNYFHAITKKNLTFKYYQDSGLVNISYFKFDVDDVTGELDSNRPVPFRMTPNVVEFMTSIGKDTFSIKSYYDKIS